MSILLVRSNAHCRLERLAHLGPGAKAVWERRRVVERLEEVRRRQVQTYNLAHQSQGTDQTGKGPYPLIF